MNATQKNIIFTAINLFKEHGYEQTSITKICETAKITKSTFYNHFPNKDELTFAYYEYLMENSLSVMKDLILISNRKEQLWKTTEYFIDNTISLTPQLLKSLLLSDINRGLNFFSPFKSPISSDSRRNNTDFQLALLKEGQLSGEIKQGDPKMMLHTYYSALIGIAIDWASNDGYFDEKKALREIFDFIF